MPAEADLDEHERRNYGTSVDVDYRKTFFGMGLLAAALFVGCGESSQENGPPTADDQSVSTLEETPVDISLVAADPDGDTLTYTIAFGPSDGVLSGTAPDITYTPNVDFCGEDGLRFRANDGAMYSSPATVTITVTAVDDAPVADAQPVTTDEDTPVSITLTGSDADGDLITYSIATVPAHGGLTGTPPDLTYSPDPDYNGADGFTFLVNDGQLDSAEATVSITVAAVNDPPAADGQSVTATEDTPLSVTLTGSDIDGDLLTYSVVTGPQHGTLTGTPDLAYTPDADYNGPDSFTFVANDGEADSAEATVSIMVEAVNDPPVADGQSVTATEDTPLSVTLAGSDVEGDLLTYSVVTGPQHGALTGTPPELTYTPDADYNGPESFTFVANDGQVDSAEATVSITVEAVNDAPVADDQSTATDEDTPLSITLTGSDVDGDALTYVVIDSPGLGVLSGAAPDLTYTPNLDLSGLDGLTFKVNDGTVDSAPANVTITVTAVNDAPTADDQSVTTDEDVAVAITLTGSDVEGDSLTFAIATGPANGALSGLEPATGAVTYTPDPGYFGQDSFTFLASDGTVDSAEATVSILVAIAPGSSRLVYYTSFVDGSLQPYGLYVPDPYDPGTPHPVSFYAHGYDGSASSSFSAYAQSFADSNGWLLIELDGRGNSFYDGTGETDLFEVIGDLSWRLNVDRSRLYFEGLSMGATGAYRLAARHVDLFAAAAGCDGWTDYRLFSAHYYGPSAWPPATPAEDEVARWEVHPARVIACEAASALYYAENLRHTPLYLSTDLTDSSVWPVNGLKLAQKLSSLGISHTSETGPDGHCALYNPVPEGIQKYYPFFAAAAPKDVAPVEAYVRTNQLKYGRAFWARALRFQRWGASGELQATASEGRIDVTVENVERYSVDFSTAPVGVSGSVEVYTNGSLSYSGATPAGELTIYATFDDEGTLVETDVYQEPAFPPLEKARDLEGPVNHALCSAWVAAYGTDPGDKTEAEFFVQTWNDWYGGSAEAVPEAAIGQPEMDEKNVVLFGTADSSTLIDQVQSALGFTLDLRADGVTFGANVYAGADYGLFMVYPNPLAPGRYVVLSHLRIADGFSTPEAWPWFRPDYVVFDTMAPMRDCYNGSWPYVADAWVEAGYFDKDWGLYNSPLDPRTNVVVSLDKASYTSSDTSALVTANVTDESASGVAGLSAGAFVLYLDGETKAVTFNEDGGGQYSASLDIDGLEPAGYVVKVLVRRADSWGMGLVGMIVQ